MHNIQHIFDFPYGTRFVSKPTVTDKIKINRSYTIVILFQIMTNAVYLYVRISMHSGITILIVVRALATVIAGV